MSKKNDFELNYYLVGFIDLLGQQEIMNELPSSLHTIRDDEMGVFKDSIRRIFRTVLEFHEGFIKFFETHNLNSEQSPLREVFGSNEIKFQRFSDGLVIYLSLKTRDINVLPLEGIFPILIACQWYVYSDSIRRPAY